MNIESLPVKIYKDSFIVINAVNSISIFVADKENKYIPLKLSFQK